MRRGTGALMAVAVAALAAPAGAAEITHVATAAERGNPFDLDLSVRWDRTQQRGQIRREHPGAFGGIGDDLRHVRTRNALVPRVAVGLYKDLELHAELPYVLGDDRDVRYAIVNGVPTGGVPPGSSIETNGIDAEGQPCATAPCPLFRVPETVYHGGRVGDLLVGVAWGIFNDRKDDTKPFWLVGLDVTFPTAKRWDPAQGRRADWSSPNDVATDPAPFGERIWKLDLRTALSRRIGVIDPYFMAHATAMLKSSSTYSNCEHATEMTAAPPLEALQMTRAGAANCAAFGSDADAKLPWVFGATFGTEIVPFENRREDQKVSIDLRGFADYTTSQRFYNELTDLTGKIHQTEGYLTMGGLVGLYLQASRYVSLQGTASIATRTAHRLTGESLGRDGAWPALGAGGITADPSLMNPNFDWRYDAPGRRFSIAEVSVFELSVAGVLRF